MSNVSHVLRRDGMSWRELNGQIIVLDLNRSSYVSIDGAGGMLWLRLAGGATLDELVDTVLDHDVDGDGAEHWSVLDDLRLEVSSRRSDRCA
jgi:hypothetical protein